MAQAQRYKLKLSKLQFCSLVDEPAQPNAKTLLIKRKGKADDIAATARLAKVNDELGLAFFWAFTSTNKDGSDHYDLQGDQVTDFIKAAMEYMTEGQGAVDIMHDGVAGEDRVVFAMPMDPEIGAAYGYVGKQTGLMVVVKPTAENLAKLKSGELNGVSIGGLGTRVPVTAAQKATWSTATIDDLPDSSFLYVEPGGKKDDQDKTTPRSLRHFPYKDANGKIDLDHLRDAASRIPQSSLPASLRDKLQRKAEKLIAAQHDDSSKRFEKRAMLTTAVAGHVHLLDDGGDAPAGETDYRDMPGAEYGGFHSHPWVRSTDGTIVIGESENHTHVALDPDDIDAIVEGGDADDDEDDAMPDKRAPRNSPPATAMPHGALNTEKSQMDKDKQIADLTAKNAELEKRHGALSKMSAVAFAVFKSLTGADAEAFLAKSDADRAPTIEAFEKSNAIEYTADDGTVYRKSDDQRMIALAKRSDEDRRALKDEQLAKRSAEVFGKATDAGKDVLRAIDGIADEKRRTAALALVKGGAEAMDRLMKASDHKLRDGFELPENGAGNGTDGGAAVETAADKLRKSVEKFQTDNKLPTYQVALAKALEVNTEIRDLYLAAKN